MTRAVNINLVIKEFRERLSSVLYAAGKEISRFRANNNYSVMIPAINLSPLSSSNMQQSNPKHTLDFLP